MLWRTRYFFSKYPLFLKVRTDVVVDFPCVVASWFRQNFDQIESIFVLIFL